MTLVACQDFYDLKHLEKCGIRTYSPDGQIDIGKVIDSTKGCSLTLAPITRLCACVITAIVAVTSDLRFNHSDLTITITMKSLKCETLGINLSVECKQHVKALHIVKYTLYDYSKNLITITISVP